MSKGRGTTESDTVRKRTLRLPHIQRYLALHRDSRRRYHVVRSSVGECWRVPFWRWAKRVKDKQDCLFDFTTREPIRIFLNSAGIGRGAGISQHAWYFVDNNGKKVRCGSGYEALFVAYLKLNTVPFEYQKWLFARAPTASRKFRKAYLKKNPPVMRMGQTTIIGSLKGRRVVPLGWQPPEGVNIRVSGVLYVPDFYLPVTDEFVEIKGWPIEPRQVAAVQYLRRMGYRIRVLEWDQLRELLGFPFLSYQTCLNRARASPLGPSRAFANQHWVKERLCNVPRWMKYERA